MQLLWCEQAASVSSLPHHAPYPAYGICCRIQVAKELLTGTSMTIEQIAAETGFCTASYFCKMFKRYEGITAVQFKRDFISTV
jgi:transcriptional regulator GlxA family with amidase domain